MTTPPDEVELKKLLDGWAFDEIDVNAADLRIILTRLAKYRETLNTPEVDDFAKGVVSEAQHQRARWGVDNDAVKTNADWFWLVGYLAGKALTAANAGNVEKALHHTISTAAALANWHAALSGADTRMRPGIEPPAAFTEARTALQEPGQ